MKMIEPKTFHSKKNWTYQTKKGESGTKIDNSGHNIEFTSLQRQLEIK